MKNLRTLCKNISSLSVRGNKDINIIPRIIDKILGNNGFLDKELSNYETRQQQIIMSKIVAKVLLKQKLNGIIEAPTGSGKSLAYAIPAIVMAKMTEQPIIISTTTKNLQGQLAEKDLPLLQKIFKKYLGLSFEFTLCKGRGNYLCLRKWHRFLDLKTSSKSKKKKKKKNSEIDMFGDESIELPETIKLASKRSAVKKKLKSKDEKKAFDDLMDWYISDPVVGDTIELGLEVNKGAIAGLWRKICSEGDDCMHWKCQYYKNCYFYKAREAWTKADLCIVNHALFFANRSTIKKTGKGFLPKTEFVIFDEADHVPSVAASYFGTEITSTWLPYMMDRFLSELSSKGAIGSILNSSEQQTLTQLVNSILIQNKEYFKKVQKFIGKANNTKRYKTTLPIDKSELINLTNQLLTYIKRAIIHHKNQNNEELLKISVAFSGHFKNFQKKLNDVTTNIKDDTCYFAQYAIKKTRYGQKVTMSAIPLDTSVMIQKFCTGLYTTYTSATLASDEGLDYFSKAVGVDLNDSKTISTILSSPFNYEQNCLLYMPTMPLPKDPNFEIQIVKQLKMLAHNVEGGIFVLFTSYMSMTRVAENIKNDATFNRPIFVQGIDGVKNVITQKFRKAGNAILLGVASFWVGVDIQGEALSCVIITKMPFERPNDPFNEAMKEYLDKQGKSYFKDCDLPRATTKIRQGFGRLIRTKKDKGVVVILDPRLNPNSRLRKQYSNPVLNSLPPCTISYDEAQVIKFLNEKNIQKIK